MRRLLIWFAVVLGACLAALAMHFSDSRVLFVVPPYTVQVSLNVLVLIVVIVLAALYYLHAGIRYLFMLPRHWVSRHQARRQKQAMLDFEQALVACEEGRSSKAVSMLTIASHASYFSLMGPYFLAKQYHRLGQADKRDAALNRLSGSDAKHLYILLAARFALDEKAYQRATELLLPRGIEDMSSPALTLLLYRLYQETGNYRSLLKVIAVLEKKGWCRDERFSDDRRHAYQELIRRLADIQAFDAFYKATPKAEQKQYIVFFIDQAIQIGYFSFARSQIELSLSLSWQPDLVLKYSYCGDDALVAQLEYAEAHLQHHPADPALLFCLGRLCRKNKLWGKAHQYLDAALSLAPSDEIRLTFVALLEECGEHEKARLIFRQIGLCHS